MTIQPVTDPNTPIGEILKAAGPEGIVLESERQGSYAVIPLDEDLIDYLTCGARSSSPCADRSAVAWMADSSTPMRRSSGV